MPVLADAGSRFQGGLLSTTADTQLQQASSPQLRSPVHRVVVIDMGVHRLKMLSAEIHSMYHGVQVGRGGWGWGGGRARVDGC